MNRSAIDLWVGIFVAIGFGAVLFLALYPQVALHPSERSVKSAVAPVKLAALPPGVGDVVVESPDPILGNKPGIVLWLEHHGVAARVEPGDELGYGGHRVHRDQPIRARASTCCAPWRACPPASAPASCCVSTWICPRPTRRRCWGCRWAP